MTIIIFVNDCHYTAETILTSMSVLLMLPPCKSW